MDCPDQRSDPLDAVGRHQPLPGEDPVEVPVELVGESDVGCDLHAEALPDRLSDLLAGRASHPAEDRVLGAIQVHDERVARLDGVARSRHLLSGHTPVGQLHVNATEIPEGKRQERLGGRLAIEPVVEEEPHALRSPAPEGTAEDPKAVAAHDRPDEVPDGLPVCPYGGDHRLGSLRGGQEREPCGTVEDLGVGIALDDGLPGHGVVRQTLQDHHVHSLPVSSAIGPRPCRGERARPARWDALRRDVDGIGSAGSAYQRKASRAATADASRVGTSGTSTMDWHRSVVPYRVGSRGRAS